MNQITNNYEKILRKLDEKTERERILVLASGIGLILFLWNALVYNPLTLSKKKTETESVEIQRILGETLAQIDKMKGAKTSSLNSAREISDKKEKTAKEVKAKKEELDGITKDLISPQEMAQVLHDMLQTIPNLSLVKMENLSPIKFQSKEDNSGVQQVVQVAVPKKVKSGMGTLLGQKDQEEQQALATTEQQTLDVASLANANAIHFYKHGLSLEFSGQFFSTILYLKMIEDLAVNFIWDSLEYEVKDHPSATIKLIVRTLSRDKGVIGD